MDILLRDVVFGIHKVGDSHCAMCNISKSPSPTWSREMLLYGAPRDFTSKSNIFLICLFFHSIEIKSGLKLKTSDLEMSVTQLYGRGAIHYEAMRVSGSICVLETCCGGELKVLLLTSTLSM